MDNIADTEEQLTPEQIRAQIVEAKRKRDEAQLERGTKQRRAVEHKQRKERVNKELLRGHGLGRDETWTIRVKPAHIKAVKDLAAALSEPGAKVSIAALMDEAIELLLARHKGKPACAEDARGHMPSSSHCAGRGLPDGRAAALGARNVTEALDA